MRNAHSCPPILVNRLSLCRLPRSRIPDGIMLTYRSLFRTLRAPLALVSLVCSTLPTSAGETAIVRVWPEYREADSFTRIAEYFGGQEKAPELIVRTHPDQRSGYYFLTRVRTEKALPGAMLALEYFVPGDEAARVHFFAVDLPAGSRAILAGLTGPDWPDAKAAPTAWRLRLLSPEGQEIAREQSFLWALPTAPAPAPAANPSTTPAT